MGSINIQLLQSKHPILLDLNKKRDRKIIRNLIKRGYKIYNFFESELNELKKIPLGDKFFKKEKRKNIDRWIVYPWRKRLVHILDEDLFLFLKTSRNLFLLTPKEQKKYYNLKIGIVGLSVGASVAAALVQEGGGSFYKIADKDSLELSNLNRVRTNIFNITRAKIDVIREEMYEMNPFIKIKEYSNGLHKKNILDFIVNPKLDFIIEETDDLRLKVNLRLYAKRFGVPVIMATSLDSKILIDYEGYGKEKNVLPFNDILTKNEINNLSSKDLKSKSSGAIKIVGKKNFSRRLSFSFQQLGKTIYAFPQLASGTYVRSALILHLIRMLIFKKIKVKSGRYIIDLNNIFNG